MPGAEIVCTFFLQATMQSAIFCVKEIDAVIRGSLCEQKQWQHFLLHLRQLLSLAICLVWRHAMCVCSLTSAAGTCFLKLFCVLSRAITGNGVAGGKHE